jgi:hypothetical protein
MFYLGADYTSDIVSDFMCDLLQIAGAISCLHYGSYSGHQIYSKSQMKSHTKSCNQPLGKQEVVRAKSYNGAI